MNPKTKINSAAKLLTSASKAELSHDDTAFAAYCLWEDEGRPTGRDWDHWFRGEELLRQARRQALIQA